MWYEYIENVEKFSEENYDLPSELKSITVYEIYVDYIMKFIDLGFYLPTTKSNSSLEIRDKFMSKVILGFEEIVCLKSKKIFDVDECDVEIVKNEDGLIKLKVTGCYDLELTCKRVRIHYINGKAID